MLFAAAPARPRELAGVGVEAVERVDVLHFDVDVLELVARLQRLAAHQPRVVRPSGFQTVGYCHCGFVAWRPRSRE